MSKKKKIEENTEVVTTVETEVKDEVIVKTPQEVVEEKRDEVFDEEVVENEPEPFKVKVKIEADASELNKVVEEAKTIIENAAKTNTENIEKMMAERKAALKAGLITPPKTEKVEAPADNRNTSAAVTNRAKSTDGRKGVYIGGFGRMGRRGSKPNKEGRASRILTHKVYDDKPVADTTQTTTAVDVKQIRGDK